MTRKELWMETTYPFPLCLYYLEDRPHEKNPFLLFSHLLKLRPEDIIKTEQQVPPCLKWVICILKYLWILGDDFSKGFKLLPGKITFGICFTVCFTRIAYITRKICQVIMPSWDFQRCRPIYLLQLCACPREPLGIDT